MRRKTLLLVGLGAIAYYLWHQSQANAGITQGFFGPSGYGYGGLPTGSMSPEGFPMNGLGARQRRRMR